MKRIPLLVITGPTASGKTQLSIDVAKALGGEIVSADSMQVYRGMDIATAKPTPEERDGVPHHLLDVLEPGTPFSVARYAQLAHEAIRGIVSRGAQPILCGGTGLYIQAVVDNLQFAEEPEDDRIRLALRARAEQEGAQALWDELNAIDPETAQRLPVGNLGRIIRALELYQTTGMRMSEQMIHSVSVPSPYDPCVVALTFGHRDHLYERINRRVDDMMAAGLLREAREMLSREDLPTACQAIGYKELAPCLRGETPLADCVEHLKQETRRYAKRQLTWLRRDKRTHWVDRDAFPSDHDLFRHVMEFFSEHLTSGPSSTSISDKRK